MKKVLFATTALVFSAGIAAAEVTLSGDGRMGIMYNGDDANFTSRARVKFNASGQTDGGLAFGASFRADQASNSKYGSAGTVFVSGAFGRIEMGDALSAPEALFGDLPEVGYEDLTSQNPVDANGNVVNVAGGFVRQGLLENNIPYLTGDSAATTADNNPIALYTYTSGPIAVAASLSDGKKLGNENAYYRLPNGVSTDDNQEYAIAAAYTVDAYSIGFGYEVLDFADGITGITGDDKATQLEIAGTATFGDTSLKAYYASGDKANIIDNAYGLGFTSKFGATTVLGYVQKASLIDEAGNAFAGKDSATWWGLGAAYSLGGGASINGGISDNNLNDTSVTADLGLMFKF